MISAPLTGGRFVITVAGWIGLLMEADPPRENVSMEYARVKVQFGASGPFSTFYARNLRWAKHSDVINAGLNGVGHVEIYEDE